MASNLILMASNLIAMVCFVESGVSEALEALVLFIPAVEVPFEESSLLPYEAKLCESYRTFVCGLIKSPATEAGIIGEVFFRVHMHSHSHAQENIL